jgi:hypothetical protein
VLSRVMDRYAPSPSPAPDAMEAFRFAPPGKLLAVLTVAGVLAPSERLLKFTMDAPISVEDFWTIRGEMSDQLRNRLATLPPEQLEEVRRQVIEALGEYSVGDGIILPAEVLIVSGAKGGAA